MNILQPLSYLYDKITQWRNQLYDNGKYPSIRFTIPTIVVGNLNTGGTGKTPHVAYIVNLLQTQQYQVAVLSRGYKRQTKGFILADQQSTAQQIGDEPMLLKQKFPDLTIAVAENRAIGIPMLLHHSNPIPQAIILDDAFQHRTVNPHLSILITEYNRPYTRDQLLPIGNLRENSKGAARANIIVVSKSPENITPTDRQAFIEELKPLPHQTLLFSFLQYGTPYPLLPHSKHPYIQATNQHLLSSQTAVLLLCGIARTDTIEQYLKKQYTHIKTIFYPDHHRYTKQNLQEIHKKFEEINNKQKIIITTEKDATKLYLLEQEILTLQLPIYCLPINVYFDENDTQLLKQHLENCIAVQND